MMMLSNSLTDLADKVSSAHADFERANQIAFDRALVTGSLLIDAKTACAHGEWLPFLSRAGVAERQAQRLMALARAGLSPDMMSDLGGMAASLAFVSSAPLPALDQVLVVCDEAEEGPMALVRQSTDHPGFFFVDGYDLRPSHGSKITSRRPMLGQAIARPGDWRFSMVWIAVHQIFGPDGMAGAFALVAPRARWSHWTDEFDEVRALPHPANSGGPLRQ